MDDEGFEQWFQTMFGKDWPTWGRRRTATEIGQRWLNQPNKGDYPELTDQLLEAELEARQYVKQTTHND